MTEEQLRFCIIHGLRPDVRTQVLQHEPKTVGEIRKWASIAETSCDSADLCNPDLSKLIRRLEEKVDRMLIRQIETPSRRTPSPGPRVHFSDNPQSQKYMGEPWAGFGGQNSGGRWGASGMQS